MAHQNSRRSGIATKITSAKKVVHAIFFTYKGLAVHVLVNECKVLLEKVLRKPVKFYPKRKLKMGICGIYLSHNNALSRKARNMTSFLKEQCVFFLEHPPFSPYIAPVTFSSYFASKNSCL